MKQIKVHLKTRLFLEDIIVDRHTEHQILPKEDLVRLAKEKIEELLRMHNLEENVDLIYALIYECRKSDSDNKIDLCVQKVIDEFEEKKKNIKQQQEEKTSKKYDVYSKK